MTWESLFGTTTSSSDVVIPVGTPVVLHGCAQVNNTVNVRSIVVPIGATVSLQSLGIMGAGVSGSDGSIAVALQEHIGSKGTEVCVGVCCRGQPAGGSATCLAVFLCKREACVQCGAGGDASSYAEFHA